MIKNIFSQKGQGLLEAVFAIGILLIVAGAILALAVSNVVGQKASEFQVRANNLSREGIEVVRSIRDANWLAGDNWDTGINGGVFARAIFDETSIAWSLDFTLNADTALWLHVSTGVHSHTVGTRQTVFKRILELRSVCLDLSTGAESIDDTCQGGDEKIGIEITSIVSWLERNQNKEIRLVNLLYAWK